MPLNYIRLYNNIMDNLIYPDSQQDAAERWCNSFDDYCKGLILKSATASEAKQSFIDTFMNINEHNGKKLFPLCFINYMNKYALGMPAANPGVVSYATVKGGLNFSPVYPLGLSGRSMEVCITELSKIIHSWSSSHTFVNFSGITTIWF